MNLRLDWCSYEAANFACKNWHYSGCMPAGKTVKIGVWEDQKFIGAIIFGLGSGNCTNGERFSLRKSHEMAELCRVALTKHTAQVSKILAVSIRLLRKQSPGIRLLTSMADGRQNHHGGIYQAGNWLYTGRTQYDYEYQLPDGKWVHHRTATARGSVSGLPSRKIEGKHRYLMPLDDEMKERLKPLAKPYPKRAASSDNGTPATHAGRGGAIPTAALQLSKEIEAEIAS